MNFFQSTSLVYQELDNYALNIEKIMNADVIWYHGSIDPGYKMNFIDEIERLAHENKHSKLFFCITTNGGSGEMVEVMVEIMRNFYDEVFFVIPDYAYSAGTILCMSGDKIFMNYYSSLGPIDPQVLVNGKFVSAQGFIDQFENIIKKSMAGTVSPVEVQMALNLNLADLNFYEQQRNLTVSLLKKWLVQYKFKDWIVHSNTRLPVTHKEKEQRAEFIAKTLGDNSLWNSHGRHIGISTLRNQLKLQIESLQDNQALDELVKGYHQLAVDFVSQAQYSLFIHSKISRR